MSTQVAIANQNMPANLAALFGSVEPVVKASVPINSLKFAGKVWKVTVEGKTQTVTMDVDGEQMPAPTVKMVMLNVGNPRERSRAMFEGGFVPGENKAPLCYSDDGVTPHSGVAEPFNHQCKGCPKSIKGSAVDENGKEIAACRQSKSIVVIPSNSATFPALQLRMAVTSLWQPDDVAKVEESKNWRSFDAYLKHLANNGVNHPAMVVTTVKFADDSNFPRLLFKSGGIGEDGRPVFEYISGEFAETVLPRLNSEEVTKLLVSGEGMKQKAQTAVAQLAAPISEKVTTVTPTVTEVAKPTTVVVEKAPEPVKPVVETAEQMEARIRAEYEAKIRAEMEAKFAQQAPTEPAPVVEESAPPKTRKKAAPPVVVEEDDDLAKQLANWD